MLDLAISGGCVATPDGVREIDIGIQDAAIVVLAERGHLPEAGSHVDASGHLVVPGGIDPHVHCNLAECWDPATISAGSDVVGRAALCGGITTLIDFVWVEANEELGAAIERHKGVWRDRTPCDYSFHIVLMGDIPERVLDQVPEAIQAGYPSFKIFTTDIIPGTTVGGLPLKAELGSVKELFEQTLKHSGITAIHAEDDELVMHMHRKLKREKRTSYVHMSEVHSTESEDLSFRRIIRLAELVGGAPIYLMHVSAASGVEAIAEARSRGLPVYGETLHQYALRNESNYRESDGMKYHTYPSLKSEADCESLWRGIAEKSLSTFATDEQCTPYTIKTSGDQIDNVVGGNAGIEPKMAILYTEIVNRRGLGIERFVDVTSTNAAKLFGMYPKKGVIAVGSDADLCVLDLNARREIDAADLHESDYSPWQGWSVDVWPSVTILRGKLVFQHGKFEGDNRHGRIVHRTVPDSVVAGARFV